jgi:hypothetical protein
MHTCPTKGVYHHTVDCGPFIKSQLALTQLILRPYVVQVWSRYPPESGGNETLVVHRVEAVNQSQTPIETDQWGVSGAEALRLRMLSSDLEHNEPDSGLAFGQVQVKVI